MLNYLLKPHQTILGTIICLLLIPFGSTSSQTEAPVVKHKMRISLGLKSPIRLAVDNQNVIYVSDAVTGRISKYDAAGNFLEVLTATGSPLAVAITSKRYVYVGDWQTGKLSLLDAQGNLVKEIASDFKLPSHAALDDEERLYVVDGENKHVKIFDANGNLESSFGDSILVFPTCVAYDRKNQRILVAEHGGLIVLDRPWMIHAFDKQGNLLTSFGKHGSEEGKFNRIHGMVVDKLGRIYVADALQGVVTLLSEQGDFLTIVGGLGAEPGKLLAPMDVAIDSDERLWIASMNNSSLEVYEMEKAPTFVEEQSTIPVPAKSELLQNYPNPFNPGTKVPFILEKESSVTIKIYNELGQRVRTFELGRQIRGSHSIYWDGRDSRGKQITSGVYLYEIRANGFVAVRRMVLLK